MTREEAIELLEAYDFPEGSPQLTQAAYMGAAALRGEAEASLPLSLEELQEMELEDWLWVEILIPSAFRRTNPGYYQIHSDFTKGESLCCGWPGTIFKFEYEDYGKTWTAYRRKPEPRTC